MCLIIVFFSFLEVLVSDMMIDFESDIFSCACKSSLVVTVEFIIEECDFIGYY